MRPILYFSLLIAAFSYDACSQSPGAAVSASVLNGEKAMEHVRAQVAFGPRPAGSNALEKTRQYLVQQLEGFGYQVEKDAFDAPTPYGPKRMVNLIAHRGSGARNIIAFASHYDTKYFENFRFVGANDGGSSTGLLLELARVLDSRKANFDYWFVFFDGEEAFVEWSMGFDGTYGSRHLAKRWISEGTAPKVKCLILLDMIGDKRLDIQRESNSTSWLMDTLWNTALEQGMQDILTKGPAADIQDDHLPFLDIGIPSVDIISWNYTPWHTAGDSLDKISASSIEKVGRLVLFALPPIEKQLASR